MQFGLLRTIHSVQPTTTETDLEKRKNAAANKGRGNRSIVTSYHPNPINDHESLARAPKRHALPEKAKQETVAQPHASKSSSLATSRSKKNPISSSSTNRS